MLDPSFLKNLATVGGATAVGMARMFNPGTAPTRAAVLGAFRASKAGRLLYASADPEATVRAFRLPEDKARGLVRTIQSANGAAKRETDLAGLKASKPWGLVAKAASREEAGGALRRMGASPEAAERPPGRRTQRREDEVERAERTPASPA